MAPRKDQSTFITQLCIMHYLPVDTLLRTCWACYRLAYTVAYMLYYTCKHLRTRDLMSMLSLIVTIVFLHSGSACGLWLKGVWALQHLYIQGSLSYFFMDRWWRQRECGDKNNACILCSWSRNAGVFVATVVVMCVVTKLVTSHWPPSCNN